MTMVGPAPRAIVLDSSRVTSMSTTRRLSRVLTGAGYSVEIPEDLDKPKIAGPPDLVVAEVSSAIPKEAIFRGSYVILYGGTEDLDPASLFEENRVVAVLSSATAHVELLAAAAYLRGIPLLPLQGYLLWGAQAFSAEITNISGREAAVSHIITICTERLVAPRKVADTAGEVVHELLTNALYDAPVDEKGTPRYTHDRTAPIELPPSDRVVFRYGTDGLRLAVEVEDRFGGLRRPHLLESLRRGLAGKINMQSGGAGIGLCRVVQGVQTLQIDVDRGRRTRLTAVLDLENRASADTPRPKQKSILFPLQGAPS